MSKPTIVPSTSDYFITVFPDGEAVVNRIVAFSINEGGTTAITLGGGVEDCNEFYFKGFHTGIIDHEGKVASGGNVFRSVMSFKEFVKLHFNPDLLIQPSDTPEARGGSFEVTGSDCLH